jgi:CheY-like chemotaxis protein
MIFVVVEDRAFMELIEAAAKAEGAFCRCFQDEASWVSGLQEEKPRFILLDIAVAFLDGPTWVEKLKQDPRTRNIPLIVFGSSIRADLMQDAKELGADKVLPKSAFRNQLPELLKHYFK